MSKGLEKVANEYNGLPGLLLRIVDIGLIGILFLAPLFMGGRHPLGQLVFVFIVAVMSVAWFSRQCLLRQAIWRSSAGQWIFLGALCLVFIQLLPLSSDWINRLSPATHALLPLWSPSGQSPVQLGNWNQLSFSPQMTLNGLIMLFAYGLTFIVIVQRVETLRDVQMILKWIALAATAMAIIGLAQYITANGKFLWTFEHAHRKADGIQGPFINPNHFCHLLALGIGPLIGWLVIQIKLSSADRTNFSGREEKSNRKPMHVFLIGVCVGLVAFTGFLAMSRGGMLAIVAAFVVATAIYYRGSLVDRRYALGAIGMILLGIILFAIHGSDKLAAELDTLTTMSLDDADYKQMRQKIWAANRAAFTHQPWFGYGVGTHREFYKIYLEEPFSVEFSHAESGYVQVGTETGLAGLFFLFSGIGMCCFWCINAIRRQKSPLEVACLGAVATALAVSAIHSVVDFVWYIPACMSWTIIFCGLACRLYQLNGEPQREPVIRLPRAVWMGTATATLILVGWMVTVIMPSALASPHWDHYQHYVEEREQFDQNRAPSQNFEKKAEFQRLCDVLDNKMEKELRIYSMKYMGNARVNLRLAANYLRQFQNKQRHSQNPMDVGQIRDAAIASRFPSRAALNEWLDRAIGEHRTLLDRALWHAHQAAAQCPLQGEAYLFLAELCFLEGATSASKSEFVNQALLVRPYDGNVLLMAGKEAAIAGDVGKAVEYWQRSFKYSIENKRELVYLLFSRIPAPLVFQMLDPQIGDLPIFYQVCIQLGDRTQTEYTCDYFQNLATQKSSNPKDIGKTWFILSRAYSSIENFDKAETCALRALECNPDQYEVRFLLATILVDRKEFVDAEKHLRWCVSRRPNEKKAITLLTETVKQRIAQPASASTATLPGTAKH